MKESDSIQKFFAAKVPKGWFTASPQVDFDADEILCVGVLPADAAVAAFRVAESQALNTSGAA